MTFFRMAARNVLRNRRRTALALCTMVFGLAALALVKSYANAVRRVQLESTVFGSTGALQVSSSGFRNNVLADPFQFSFEDSPELRSKIRRVAGVTGLAPRIQLGGLFSLPERDQPSPSTPLVALAIDPIHEKIVCPKVFDWITDSNVSTPDFQNSIVLHADLFRSLKMKRNEFVGKTDTDLPALLTNDVDGNLNGVPLFPSGSFKGLLPGDKRIAYIDLRAAQALLRIGNKITSYAVAVDTLDDTPAVQRELKASLGNKFEVTRWDELAPAIKDILRNLDLIFAIVSLIFIFLVGLGVANAVLISVMERKQEIGTILSLGGTRRQIVQGFVLEGLLLGIAGGLLGSVIGWLAVLVLHRIGINLSAPGSDVTITLRVFLNPSYLIAAFFVNCVLSVFASCIPALKASKLNPVEALKSS